MKCVRIGEKGPKIYSNFIEPFYSLSFAHVPLASTFYRIDDVGPVDCTG